MKILVIFTGGTIGSTLQHGYIATDSGKSRMILERYHRMVEEPPEFECISPYSLLSENLTGSYIAALCKCINENIRASYDGILVAHGTDTLQYSAAAAAYALGNIEIPVMFVSADYVLDNPKSNGLDNFFYSVEFINSFHGNGVFVVYRNADNRVYVHRATRLLSYLPYSNDLYSLLGQYYGVYINGQFHKNENYHADNHGSSRTLPVPTAWNSNILRIFPHPGMNYPSLNSSVRAVLLGAYHSGTICALAPDLHPFLNEAKSLDIPVFLTGAMQDRQYESAKSWENLNITILPPASDIAMYIKLWMASELTAGRQLNMIMKECIGEDFVTVQPCRNDCAN